MCLRYNKFHVQLDITSDSLPPFVCKKCNRSLQMVSKIRRDFLIVDEFWKTFLAKHGSTVNHRSSRDDYCDTLPRNNVEPVETEISCDGIIKNNDAKSEDGSDCNSRNKSGYIQAGNSKLFRCGHHGCREGLFKCSRIKCSLIYKH